MYQVKRSLLTLMIAIVLFFGIVATAYAISALIASASAPCACDGTFESINSGLN